MSTVGPKECIMLYTIPPFSPQPLFLGDTNMVVFHANPSCLHCQAMAKHVHCVHTAHAEAVILTQEYLSRGWGFLEDPLAPRHKANAQME